MDESLKVFEKVFFEKVSNQKLLRQFNNNPIRQYEDELIDGAIVDIGCGQSPFLLDFASTDKELIAIDNEQFQLDFLNRRLEQQNPEKKDNWSFLNQTFPKDSLPDKRYSLIILSNILHFYTFQECIKIGEPIKQKASKGTLVYVAVHSDRHYTNNPKDPNNNIYFKHFFKITDLAKVFPSIHFERLYCAEIERSDSKMERDLISAWLDEYLKSEGITDPKEIALEKKDYLKSKNEAGIVAIFRRK
jgi:ubiquinone/menaquinone biosynthesis C-methylase UbiE